MQIVSANRAFIGPHVDPFTAFWGDGSCVQTRMVWACTWSCHKGFPTEGPSQRSHTVLGIQFHSGNKQQMMRRSHCGPSAALPLHPTENQGTSKLWSQWGIGGAERLTWWVLIIYTAFEVVLQEIKILVVKGNRKYLDLTHIVPSERHWGSNLTKCNMYFVHCKENCVESGKAEI